MKLIVEMEIPLNCKKCPLVGMDHFGQIRCKGQGGRLIHLKNFQTEIERPSWCPIVGVLPDEHGDLIDRDELFETIKSRVTLIDSCPEEKPSMKELFERDVLCTCLHDVVCAKAVIAAERKDDEQIH